MRATRLGSITAAIAAGALLAGCSGGGDAGDAEAEGATTLQVAAVTSPMTDVVEAAASAIGDGYEIELVEVGDYVTANTILAAGDVDANFSQHVPFMEGFNAANDADLVGVTPVYDFTIAFYSRTIDDVADLPRGATVAIPDDASNAARALAMLDDAGIVTIDESVDRYESTVGDVVENPLDVEFLELPIPQLNTALDEADLVFQWPSHVAALGLDPDDDGLLTELDDRFALNLVVRGEDEDSPATAALVEAFTSDEVREVIEANDTIEVAFP